MAKWLRLGVMAIQTVEIAALQENYGAVSRPVYATEGDDSTKVTLHLLVPRAELPL